MKPSSARWATRSEPLHCSGGVPMTTTRGHEARLRISGVKNCWRATSWSAEVRPVASKTRPLYFWPSSVTAVLAMPTVSSRPGSDSARRPVPPTTTVPSTSGSPAV